MEEIDHRPSLRILLVGSAVGDHFWALHVNRYTRALSQMGHDVEARDWRHQAHHNENVLPSRGFDLVILQDTHLPIESARALKDWNAKTVLLTHSELIQGQRDKQYISTLRPDYIFTDQPAGVDVFRELGIPAKWMGHGADPGCYRFHDKPIDILWVGNRYEERQELIEDQLYPLLDQRTYVFCMHGEGYVHQALKPSVMFDVMARSKCVIHIGHPVTYKGGYSGTRISDAMASGCFVVSTRYPRAHERFPVGALFVGDLSIRVTALGVAREWETRYKSLANAGYEYVRKFGMATNDMQMVLDSLKERDENR